MWSIEISILHMAWQFVSNTGTKRVNENYLKRIPNIWSFNLFGANISESCTFASSCHNLHLSDTNMHLHSTHAWAWMPFHVNFKFVPNNNISIMLCLLILNKFLLLNFWTSWYIGGWWLLTVGGLQVFFTKRSYIKMKYPLLKYLNYKLYDFFFLILFCFF